MLTPLLVTKFAIPVAGNVFVARLRLLPALDTAMRLAQRLVLFSAPAGSGKTTAITSCLAEITALNTLAAPDIAWLTCDTNDNRPEWFLAYLIGAIEQVRPGAGELSRALLHTLESMPIPDMVLIPLLNAISAHSTPLVVVLDDYHTITHPLIHTLIALLLDRMPAHMLLVIASRADPPLPLARLRVRRHMTEVRSADLRFTLAETEQFFTHGANAYLSQAELEAVVIRTEGWAAALQLIMLALHEHGAAQRHTFIESFTGSHRYLFDYLVEEVIAQQPAHVQSFLLQTASLTRLNGPLCDAVTGRDDSQALLDQLERNNLFLIRLDDTRHWYRYHHLFADFLHERLLRAGEAGVLQVTHQRASAWYAAQGLEGLALDHALAAHDWDLALPLLTALMAESRLYVHTLDWPRWLAALPEAWWLAHPDCALDCARVLVLVGYPVESAHLVALAEGVYQATGNLAQCGKAQLIQLVQAAFRADLAALHTHAAQALALLPPDDHEQRAIATLGQGLYHLGRGDVQRARPLLVAAHLVLQHAQPTFESRTAWGYQGFAEHLCGHLHSAAALYQRVIEHYAPHVHLRLPLLYIRLAELHYEWNDLAAAEQTIRQGILVGQQTGRIRYWPRAYILLARVLWARGAAAEALVARIQAEEVATILGIPAVLAELHAYLADVALAEGDFATAARWVAQSGLHPGDTPAYPLQEHYWTLAKVVIAQAQHTPDTAAVSLVITLLEGLRDAAQVAGRVPDVVRCLVLLACAYAALPASQQALATLRAALALARPGGYMRTFRDAGSAMQQLLSDCRVSLLRQAVQHHEAASEELLRYLDQLLLLWGAELVVDAPKPSIYEPLSARERHILRLVASGQVTEEIAETLTLSVHTVRTHLKNIYGKLAVHSRSEAIARARQLALL